jgi:predicted Rossmann fold nucleotide-binding protein DprA/Smf involved in DNA uptake
LFFKQQYLFKINIFSSFITSIKELNLSNYLPCGVTEIVSGGAIGPDRIAAEYARNNGIILVEFLPEYARYRGGAPHVRNRQIAECADEVLAFWGGKSKGTMKTVELFKALGKKATVITIHK